MILSITYYGYSCFAIKSYEGVTIVTDPYHGDVGATLPPLAADIVLISHAHAAHNCVEAIPGNPSVIQGPGVRELGWVKICGIETFHDRVHGKRLGKNTVFVWDMRAVKLCHLGDCGSVSSDLAHEIGQVDILFVPIGGKNTLSPTDADQAIALIKPKYVIPMHYKTPYFRGNFDYTLAEFIKGKNNTIIPQHNTFVLTKKNREPEQTQILALEYRPYV
jgi:L-ascorbate metabolism protein UlaG (beta-lactamase superfamily)